RLKVPEGVKIIIELADNLPDIKVDALQIQQVFYNIASNGIQVMEKGGELVISSLEERDTGYIAITFKDTGGGIPKGNMDKIFNPLFSTKIKGTGLGLSVCASLVEGHAGKIEVESIEGKGATFIVKLPVNIA
ncbi:MAG: ATP-binding protein, partial [Candidatus Omnitrophota bacterium]